MENPQIIKDIFLAARENVIRDILAKRKNKKNKLSFSSFAHAAAERIDNEPIAEKVAIVGGESRQQEESWEQDFFVNTVFNS